jgi:hypothetical protein
VSRCFLAIERLPCIRPKIGDTQTYLTLEVASTSSCCVGAILLRNGKDPRSKRLPEPERTPTSGLSREQLTNCRCRVLSSEMSLLSILSVRPYLQLGIQLPKLAFFLSCSACFKECGTGVKHFATQFRSRPITHLLGDPCLTFGEQGEVFALRSAASLRSSWPVS